MITERSLRNLGNEVKSLAPNHAPCKNNIHFQRNSTYDGYLY